MSKLYERVRKDVYTEFPQVSVNLTEESLVVMFNKKLQASWAVGQMMMKNNNVIWDHSMSIRVNNPGIYKMQLCQINANMGALGVVLPFSVVLYEDYKTHPTFGQYIGWGYFGHIFNGLIQRTK